ncbi:MAG TPA: sialidase family protein [Spirillospora sp.]|nr:sialidase family protein [Spirillospora sp.]
MTKVPLLANDFVTLYESPDPAGAYCYTPGIIRLNSGRLIATMDLGGPNVDSLNPPVSFPRAERGFTFVGKIFTSDDGGQTWVHRADFPFMHARPFAVGDSIYILGQAHDLMIIRSDDRGETWSEPARLTEGEYWHQSACNVHYANDCVYLVMEKRVYFEQQRWPVHEMAPVLMRAPVNANLLDRASWTLASELAFHDVLPGSLDLMGFPFWTPYETQGMAPMGWLETNVVQFLDLDHVWYDPTGHTFHLWMRAHTGGTGYAAIAKVIENTDGTMTTMIETVPSGQRILYVPCPGGQMRFHVLYDEQTKPYWLLSSLAWDSMTHVDKLPPDRYNLPNNERHVLALHFSKNMIDWRMAGVVARGNSPREARHYASMAFDGDDLLVLSRSGDHRAKNAHDGNLITFHRVRNFRDLVY